MSEKTMPITGGCMCGAMRYESSDPPVDVYYCHCRMCQKARGGPFSINGEFHRDKFRFTRGQPKFYRSSAWLERGFCAECGTPLASRYFKNGTIFVSIGSLDHPEDAPPEMHWGIESQISWLTIDDGLPRMRTEDDPEFVAAKAAAGQQDK